ncbi:MAG TPA: phosphopantetheine-binding protein [Chthoniobacteraceae bacterium]|nr:phosphopantetheine-binding protein [Chthoniobacteraceae bacterium]
MPTPLTEEQAAALRDQFKRCDTQTVDAILKFRGTGDIALLPVIVRGVVRRYLPADKAGLLDAATEETNLADLHIESLTMLEIVLDIQDAVEVVIEDTELREIKTLADVRRFLEAKLAAKQQQQQ